MTAVEALAALAADAQLADARGVRAAARRTIVNAVVVALGGSQREGALIALRASDAFGLVPEATVLGHGTWRSIRGAAFVNGVSAHIDDFDDTHFATIVHPGAAVVPAALAVAEEGEASGPELVDAVAVGVEVALRVGLAVYPRAFDRGWHMSGIAGPVGAAAAVGRLLGLDAAQLTQALALAAAQPAGTQEALGTMTKPLHLGKAAVVGIDAALRARDGLATDRAPGAIDALRHATGSSGDDDAAFGELGRRWELERNAFKPYACGVVSHAAIDAAVAAGRRCDPHEIRALELRTNPVVLDVMGKAEPRDGLEAKFSVHHAVAVGLLHGAAGPLQFEDDVVHDPEVDRLRRLVRVTLDPACRVDEARLELRLGDGRSVEVQVDHARSSPDAPLTDDDLREKALTVAAPAFGAAVVTRFVDALFELDEWSSVAALLAARAPDAVAAA